MPRCGARATSGAASLVLEGSATLEVDGWRAAIARRCRALDARAEPALSAGRQRPELVEGRVGHSQLAACREPP